MERNLPYSGSLLYVPYLCGDFSMWSMTILHGLNRWDSLGEGLVMEAKSDS